MFEILKALLSPKFWKQLRKEIQEDKQRLAERKREHDEWKQAGRPTGPCSCNRVPCGRTPTGRVRWCTHREWDQRF